MSAGMSAKGSSRSDVLAVLKDILNKSGDMSKFQAEMRAKVTELLHDRQTTSEKNAGPPTPTEEVLLVNELVREYLEWNGYLYTASVLVSEAAMPKEKKTRANMCAEVGVRDDEKSSSLPLLSNIVAAYTERIRRKINKIKKDGQ